MSKIKYPNYTYKQTSVLLNKGTSPVAMDNARSLMAHSHFVFAWDGNEEPTDTCVTFGVLTGVSFTADTTQYEIYTANTNVRIHYENAVYIHNIRCPEVLVKSEGGAFVGKLIGIDADKGMAVVQCNETVACYSLSIVSYVDDVNKDLLGLRVEEKEST